MPETGRSPAPLRPPTPLRQRIGRLVLVLGAAGAFVTVASRWPKDNVVHVVLGPEAPDVEDVHLRYAPAPKNGPMVEDWTRETEFRFPGGTAPRIVTQEPRVADGDYVVEIEIVKAPQHAIIRLQRRVTLSGGTTSIDVTEALAEAK